MKILIKIKGGIVHEVLCDSDEDDIQLHIIDEDELEGFDADLDIQYEETEHNLNFVSEARILEEIKAWKLEVRERKHNLKRKAACF